MKNKLIFITLSVALVGFLSFSDRATGTFAWINGGEHNQGYALPKMAQLKHIAPEARQVASEIVGYPTETNTFAMVFSQKKDNDYEKIVVIKKLKGAIEKIGELTTTKHSNVFSLRYAINAPAHTFWEHIAMLPNGINIFPVFVDKRTNTSFTLTGRIIVTPNDTARIARHELDESIEFLDDGRMIVEYDYSGNNDSLFEYFKQAQQELTIKKVALETQPLEK